MKEIVIFAGTTEGRRLSESLAAAGIRHIVCVATEYGEMVLQPHPLVTVHCGRMNLEEMQRFFLEKQVRAVVDATHPYASQVKKNIRAAVEEQEMPYLRLRREDDDGDGSETGDRVRYFSSHQACASALMQTEGRILLTTGSSHLEEYCSQPELRERLYVRVLPGLESIRLCMEQNLCGKQILALQGPFSVELNEAIMRQYRIACVVTKKSGGAGGYPQKLEAARRVGAECFVILPENEDGREAAAGQVVSGGSFVQVVKRLEELCGRRIPIGHRMQIILAGIGMDGRNTLTGQVKEAIRDADILLGAQRMIEPYEPRVEKKAYYQKEQILPYLHALQQENRGGGYKVVVLFSGDTGFYSGCQQLFTALHRAIDEGTLEASLDIMPGVSSVSYLSSCIGESYHDAVVVSIHGKPFGNLLETIAANERTFLLMSGASDVRRLGELLVAAGLTACEVTAGYQLGYPQQRIRTMSAAECMLEEAEGLYTCFIRNPQVRPARLVHGMADSEFIREKVPMTKEEVRDVSLCKLRLHERAVVYDIGSGTGSIAVEIGRLSDTVQVYALERKPEAVSLICKNKEKFSLSNITVVEAEAPEGLESLPVPTHAFIGGSGGRMEEILKALYQKNNTMRVVINAISMETICEIREALTSFPITGEEVVQMQVSRTKKVGSYHLMQAENPVWICGFDFVPKGE